MADQPYVRFLPLAYPASEIYFFKPLKERVAVYQMAEDHRPDAQSAPPRNPEGRMGVHLRGSGFQPRAQFSWRVQLVPHEAGENCV
jgi:hypothetical protein